MQEFTLEGQPKEIVVFDEFGFPCGCGFVGARCVADCANREGSIRTSVHQNVSMQVCNVSNIVLGTSQGRILGRFSRHFDASCSYLDHNSLPRDGNAGKSLSFAHDAITAFFSCPCVTSNVQH